MTIKRSRGARIARAQKKTAHLERSHRRHVETKMKEMAFFHEEDARYWHEGFEHDQAMNRELNDKLLMIREYANTLGATVAFDRGSLFFDDAPTTRMRARTRVRKEISGHLLRMTS